MILNGEQIPNIRLRIYYIIDAHVVQVDGIIYLLDLACLGSDSFSIQKAQSPGLGWSSLCSAWKFAARQCVPNTDLDT